MTIDDSLVSLMGAADAGSGPARESLFTALYGELHRIARRELARNGAAGTLGVTTLLHETYLEMAGRRQTSFPDRARFMGYAARVMRGLIIDRARERQAIKRGGLFEITALETDVPQDLADHGELSELSAALDQLAEADPPLAEVVDLRFFCGFTMAEIAVMSGTTERTVQRRWEKARIYLHRHLRPEHELAVD